MTKETNYKAVIWDFDGTLFDTYTNTVQIFRRVLEEEGIREEYEGHILLLMRNSIPDAYEYYKKVHGLTEEAVRRFFTYESKVDKKAVELYPSAYEVCQKLYEKQVMNLLYTHRDDAAKDYLKIHGLSPYFTECVTANNGFEKKPSPKAVRYLAEKYQLKPETMLMVGDRNIDVLAGKNAGADGCFFKWNKSEKDFEQADYNIYELTHILDIVNLK